MVRVSWPMRAVEGVRRALSPGPGAPELGSLLGGRFEILRMVGQGGNGLVFQAEDTVLGMQVAIKILLPSGSLGRTSAEALKREARLTLGLTHPRIVRTYSWEKLEDWDAVVMEWVGGGSVLGLQRKAPLGRLPGLRVIELGLQTLDALGFAHGKDVCHNDIKPQNLLLDHRGEVKLCDFGLSGRVLVDDDVVMGTPSTIAPERIRGGQESPVSDLYSLGATLWQLVAGSPPYGYGQAALDGHLRGELPKVPFLVAELRQVLAVALERDPGDRYQDAASMARALRSVHDAVARSTSARASSSVPDMDPTGSPWAALVATDTTGMVSIPRRLVRVADRAGGKRVQVGPVWLDAHLITHREYHRFAQDASARRPAGWPEVGGPPPELLDLPVTGVSLEDARAYARWAGKRLPTTTEWTAAALANPDGSALPFEEPCERTCACPGQGATGPEPVGDSQGRRTLDGVQDLYGNVWEWTEPDPVDPPLSDDHAVAMGGSWQAACHARLGHIPRLDVRATARRPDLGFRCAAGDLPDHR